MTRRWLLLLGSTLADDARVRAALVALGELGAVRLLAPIRHGPGSRDPRRSYFNALAELECALGRDPLIAALKAIEHTLGRRRGQAEVAIDIDLLACG
ncbi:MAG: 2-amino-4-hydroxy-6-hydroxymethyldihydropteridine diphosphokinase, partial [Rhodanobacteraceae bacterium]|nr:2-amino-4-hydroxy-6-hydroxymethyldihydropteridine diphosphokinase [Rhodanobacteraceae bacterium]